MATRRIDDVLNGVVEGEKTISPLLSSLVSKDTGGPEVNTAYRTAYETAYDTAYRTAYETCGYSRPLGIPETEGQKTKAEQELERRAKAASEETQR
jgi:hypothetical protein